MVYGVRGAVVGRGRHHGRDHEHHAADVPRRDDHGAARRLADEAARQHLGRQDQARLRDAGQQLLRRHPGGACWPSSGFYVFGPVIEGISDALGNGVNWLIDHSLLPLASIIIEPAKVLFLNNAINHGVLTPLGIQQAAAAGQVDPVPARGEPRPGSGSAAGLLDLRHRAGQEHRTRRRDHPVLRRHPRDLLPVRADEAADPAGHDRRRHGGHLDADDLQCRPAGAGGARVDHRGAGRRRPAAASSGSACRCCSPPSTSFVIASIILRASRKRDESGDLAAATAQMEAMKGKKSSVSGVLTRPRGTKPRPRSEDARGRGPGASPIHKIVFACDAGMGSSAMGASVLRNKVKKAGFTRRQGGQRGDRQPDRRRRPDRHPPGPHRRAPGTRRPAPSTSRSTTS